MPPSRTCCARVLTRSGRILYERERQAHKALVASAHVGAMSEMLNAALVTGTGKRAALPRHPAAGKTGTSQGFRDAWFVGYTAHLTTGVWTGNDNGRAMNRVFGGGLPAEIWREVMLAGHAGRRPTPLAGTAVVGRPTVRAPAPVADDPIARTLEREPETTVGDAGGARWATELMSLGRARE